MQILGRHVFLGESDLNRAALLLQLRQAPPLFAQRFFAPRHVGLLRLLLADQRGGLRIDLLALVLQPFDLAARFLDF